MARRLLRKRALRFDSEPTCDGPHAIARGVVILAAAGNVWPWVVYPARFDQVIAVAACNGAARIWRDSASGPAVDGTAPGESVWVARTGDSPGPTDDHVDVGSGTSFAVATTAGGLCALARLPRA